MCRCRSEVGILTSTALLNRVIKQVTSEALLQEIVCFLLGEEEEPEAAAATCQNPLRHRLIEHCDHLSDEVLTPVVLLKRARPGSYRELDRSPRLVPAALLFFCLLLRGFEQLKNIVG